jgi:type IV secretory pathway protease TraF
MLSASYEIGECIDFFEHFTIFVPMPPKVFTSANMGYCKYKTSVPVLKRVNGLSGDGIRVGQSLRIP